MNGVPQSMMGLAGTVKHEIRKFFNDWIRNITFIDQALLLPTHTNTHNEQGRP